MASSHVMLKRRKATAFRRRASRNAGVRPDPSDFSVIVKRKPSQSVSKWRWEIYRVGRSSPVKSSDYEFETMSTAKTAADEALVNFRKSLFES